MIDLFRSHGMVTPPYAVPGSAADTPEHRQRMADWLDATTNVYRTEEAPMTDTIIPLDNERGQPAYIRLRQPDIDERKASTMRAQAPDRLSDAEWRRVHAFMEAQRERPVVGAKLWRGIRFAMLPSLILWLCLTALFAWALFG